MMEHASRYIVQEVTDLLSIAPTDVVMVPGNHDKILSKGLKILLSHVFEHEESLTILPGDTHCLFNVYDAPVMATHGDNLNASKASSYLSRFSSGDIRKENALVLSGHFHTFAQKFVNYVTHIICASLSPADGWHADRGFLSRRGITLLRIEKSTGHTGTLFIPMEE